jgi:hypothetical protein
MWPTGERGSEALSLTPVLQSANENLSPSGLRKVLAEVASLAQEPMEDIAVEANEANLSEVHAVITGPSECPSPILALHWPFSISM